MNWPTPAHTANDFQVLKPAPKEEIGWDANGSPTHEDPDTPPQENKTPKR